jgi:hypothetical protein
MPFFNNRPKKHTPNPRPEAKLTLIVAEKAPSQQLHLAVREVETSFPTEIPPCSVISQPMSRQ